DDLKSFRCRERRHLVLQRRQFPHVFQRQQISTRAERLADLDESWTKADQRLAHPHGLLLKTSLLSSRAFDAAKNHVTQHAYEPVKRDVKLRPGPGFESSAASLFARHFSNSRHGAAIEVCTHVISIEKQIQREQPEHARDSRGAQPTMKPSSGQKLIDQLFRQRRNLCRRLVYLRRSGLQAFSIRFCSLNK